MKQLLTDTMLEDVSGYISEQMGLHFPRSKWRSLEQALQTAAGELGFQDSKACIDWLLSAPPSKETIASMSAYLTIGETYFLRESRSLEILEQQIIPEIIQKRQTGEKRLRIWSAGCATGEEPYTIAILLHRMRKALRGWDISIMATDINPHALCKAREGVYSEWSFRNAPSWLKDSYFIKTDNNRFEVIPLIKEMVNFSSFNLVKDLYPSLLTNSNAMDIIFCRNVLMYFSPEQAEKVFERFNHCLLDGGWLFVSPCEISNPSLSRFSSVNFIDAILYRKRGPESGELRLVSDHLLPDLTEHRLESEPPSFYAEAPQSVPTVTSPLPKSPSPCNTLAPEEAASAKELCRICANEGKLGEALLLSEQAITGDKLNAGLHYFRSVILLEQGMPDEAAVSLKRALYLDQDLVMAHFTLGNLALRKGKTKESRKYFDNALALLDRCHPNDILPESEGIVAGRLAEIIRSTNHHKAKGHQQ